MLRGIAPIFITGIYRSGTTIVSNIMNNHPDYRVVYDSVNFMRFCYGKYDPVNRKERYTSLLNDLQQRLKARYDWELNIPKVIATFEDKEVSYAMIYDSVMRSLLLEDENDKSWGEKTTLEIHHLPAFLEMFPEAHGILVLRDPRAVLASFKYFTTAKGKNYLDAVFNMKFALQAAIEYQKKYTRKQLSILQFEQLIQHPTDSISSLCASFGMEFHPSMLDLSKMTNLKGEKWSGNSTFSASDANGFQQGNIDRWKEKLEYWEIAFTEFVCKPEMELFNYKAVIEQPETYQAQFESYLSASPLLTDGWQRFLETGKGVERFPADPLDSDNWVKEHSR